VLTHLTPLVLLCHCTNNNVSHNPTLYSNPCPNPYLILTLRKEFTWGELTWDELTATSHDAITISAWQWQNHQVTRFNTLKPENLQHRSSVRAITRELFTRQKIMLSLRVIFRQGRIQDFGSSRAWKAQEFWGAIGTDGGGVWGGSVPSTEI